MSCHIARHLSSALPAPASATYPSDARSVSCAENIFSRAVVVTCPVAWYSGILLVVWATMQSYIAISTCCPRPVLRRASSASITPSAVHTPGTESPTLSPTICGPLSGAPVSAIQPPMPCTQGLFAGQLE